jgi:hypothetical protein
MPLHVMEQPPRFFSLAYRASIIIIIIIKIIRRRNEANTIYLPNFVWGT